MAAGKLELPLIDFSSPDRAAAAKSIRQACLDHGFFYLINHGIEKELFERVFRESKKFFSLPVQAKMELAHNKHHRGYTHMYSETLDHSSKFKGELTDDDNGNYGASAHSDYGMITLLATDGVPGLQICREKEREPQHWEDVHHLDGAFIVNVGDMLERWTNCLFRSTLHRVLAIGKERYSVAFFFDPDSDCIVECLESCCSEMSPPRFPPIRSGDYLQQRLRSTYASFPG